jgi:short-subunit dehydrogenase involved in D-alanine esterification of teichoic acids
MYGFSIEIKKYGLKNNTILFTGVGSGIGLEACKQFL